MVKRHFKFNFNKCIGCCACAIACKQQNESDKGEGLRNIMVFNEARSSQLPLYHISLSCNHCHEPKCMEVCLQGAIHKTEYGVVYLDSKRCDECRKCMAACPYGAIKYSKAIDRIIKCNMCSDLNIPEPFCVKACPMGALTIGEDDDHQDGQVFALVLKDMYTKAIGGSGC